MRTATPAWAVVGLSMLLAGLVATTMAWAAPGETAPDLSQALVTINGRGITRAELYRRVEEAGGERVLADLVARRLIEDAFDAAGLKLTAAEMDATLAALKSQALTEADWQAFLTKQGMTEADLREALSFQLKVKHLAEKDVDASDAAVRRFYDEHAERFGRPETVMLSEIVLRDEAKARRVRALIKTPADFAKMVREQSVAVETRQREGLRPEEALAELQPEALREAVAALTVGRVSEPIPTDEGWRIVRLEERTPAQMVDFALVQEDVRQMVLSANAKQVPALLQELAQAAQIKVVDPRYSGLTRMFEAPPAQ